MGNWSRSLLAAVLALGALVLSPLVPGWQQAEGKVAFPKRFTFKSAEPNARAWRKVLALPGPG